MPPVAAPMQSAPKSAGQMPPQAPSNGLITKADKDRQLKLLARSVCKELRSQGYEPREIINLATEILTQVTADIVASDER